MSHPMLSTHDDLRRAVCAISADIEAALALSRAALHAVATLSTAHCAATELALDEELERAHEFSAIRTVEVLEDARSRLQLLPAQMALMGVLEEALQAAADALPDLEEPWDAETQRPQ